MFKVCGIIEISETKFFNFCVTERVNKNFKKLKTIQNLLSSQHNLLLSKSKKSEAFFCFFTENVTLFLPVNHCLGHNTDLTSNSNISKMVRVNIVFTERILESIQ